MPIFRSRTPLRLGLAGGGTDVSPFSDLYGGAVLNATISLYAYATIEPSTTGIVFEASDSGKVSTQGVEAAVQVQDDLPLHCGVHNSIFKNDASRLSAYGLNTYVDAPPGSGLGSSSTLVVAILGAFAEWLKLPLGEYDIAQLAYDIERKDLGFAGGKQDQYAATFGGINFMEFSEGGKVIVNPLRVKPEYLHELEQCLVLYNTRTSRVSSEIIEAQTRNVEEKKQKSVEAMHKLKEQAILMKECLLKGNINQIGEVLDFGWQYKKQMADGISNPQLDEMYSAAKQAGATGGKISGAGGGGFMVFFCPGTTRYKVVEALKEFGGRTRRFDFTKTGLTTWTMAS